MTPLGKPLAGIKLKMPKGSAAITAAKPPSTVGKSAGAPPPVKPMNTGQVGVRTPKAKSMPDATDKPSTFYKSEISTAKVSSVQKLKDFLSKHGQKKTAAQSSADTRSPDMSEKKFTPTQAHQAVLAKVQELLSKSPLMKGEGVNRDAGAPLRRKVEYDKAGDTVNSQIAAEGAKDNHKKKLAEMQAAPKPNLEKTEGAPAMAAPGDGSNLRGHLKLAKFLGKMEEKRKKAPLAPEAAPAPVTPPTETK